MTPEERGAKAADECVHCKNGIMRISDNFALTIAAHIRDAVAEEREACAKIAQGRGIWWHENKPETPKSKDNSEEWFRFHEGNHKMLMSYEIAAAIRARKSE